MIEKDMMIVRSVKKMIIELTKHKEENQKEDISELQRENGIEMGTLGIQINITPMDVPILIISLLM